MGLSLGMRLDQPAAPRGVARDRNRSVMRHRVGHRKLGRVTEHRIAMLRNQAEALLAARAHRDDACPRRRSCGPFVERLITIAKRGIAAGDADEGALHARRLVLRDIQNRDVVSKLFDDDRAALRGAAGRLHPHPPRRLPPRRQRRGRADRAGRQRVRPERRGQEGRDRRREQKPKGVGDRLRAAADRLRGKAKAGGRRGAAATTTPRRRRPSPSARMARAARPTPAAREPRRRAPRKAGGS